MTHALKPCGTNAAYYRHINHGEEACSPCLRAHADDQTTRIQQRSRNVPDHVHGTAGGYINYGCRCQPCMATHAASSRASRGYPPRAAVLR